MERFEKRHEGRITGIISGFDRMIFRGTLRSVSYEKGMEIWLTSRRVLYKDFGHYAEGLSEQIREHARQMSEQEGRPYIYLYSSQQSKEEIAQGIIEQDNLKEGLVCVLSCVEPCWSYRLCKNNETKQWGFKKELRKCQQFYFYYLDREFGMIHVRLQTWLPFPIQVYVNGREWLARAMDRKGIGYEKADNCFTKIDDCEGAQALSDQLDRRRWVGFLNALARRVNPLLKKEAGLSLRQYYWTLSESEYATDVLFKSTKDLDAIYPTLSRHALEEFGSEDVLRFLSRRVRGNFQGEISSRFKQRIEGTRIKHRVEENSIKMYNKAGSVLRIETTINQPYRFRIRRWGKKNGKRVKLWLPLRKGVSDTLRRVEISRGANSRYLDALAVVGETKPSSQVLDAVSKPVNEKGRRYRALRPITSEESRVYGVILRGEHNLQGLRNKDLRLKLYPESESDPEQRACSSSRVSRHLRLLRAHKLIYKVRGNNYYRITKRGQEVMSTALKFRETDIALLAA
jgi:hypothetical protein